MNLLIYGAAELGYLVARRLYQEHSITLIDNLEKLPDRFNNLDISFVSGNGSDIDGLEQANVKKCDLFIVNRIRLVV